LWRVRAAPLGLGSVFSNHIQITDAPKKYELLPLPHAAMQRNDTVSDFSWALCRGPPRFRASRSPPPEATQAIKNALTPLPIGSWNFASLR
jgi:hypothetical protein